MAEQVDPQADELEKVREVLARASSPTDAGRPARPPGADYYGEYDENGVDLSLLRYTLSLSPLERLQRMEKHARDTLILMEYGRRHRERSAGGRKKPERPNDAGG